MKSDNRGKDGKPTQKITSFFAVKIPRKSSDGEDRIQNMVATKRIRESNAEVISISSSSTVSSKSHISISSTSNKRSHISLSSGSSGGSHPSLLSSYSGVRPSRTSPKVRTELCAQRASTSSNLDSGGSTIIGGQVISPIRSATAKTSSPKSAPRGVSRRSLVLRDSNGLNQSSVALLHPNVHSLPCPDTEDTAMQDFFMPSRSAPSSIPPTAPLGLDMPSIESDITPPRLCQSEEQISPIRCEATPEQEILPVDVQVAQEKINRWLHDPNHSCSRDPYYDQAPSHSKRSASKRSAFSMEIDVEHGKAQQAPAAKRRRPSSPLTEPNSGSGSTLNASSVTRPPSCGSISSNRTASTSSKTTPHLYRATNGSPINFRGEQSAGSNEQVYDVQKHVLGGHSEDRMPLLTPKRLCVSSCSSPHMPFRRGISTLSPLTELSATEEELSHNRLLSAPSSPTPVGLRSATAFAAQESSASCKTPRQEGKRFTDDLSLTSNLQPQTGVLELQHQATTADGNQTVEGDFDALDCDSDLSGRSERLSGCQIDLWENCSELKKNPIDIVDGGALPAAPQHVQTALQGLNMTNSVLAALEYLTMQMEDSQTLGHWLVEAASHEGQAPATRASFHSLLRGPITISTMSFQRIVHVFVGLSASRKILTDCGWQVTERPSMRCNSTMRTIILFRILRIIRHCASNIPSVERPSILHIVLLAALDWQSTGDIRRECQATICEIMQSACEETRKETAYLLAKWLRKESRGVQAASLRMLESAGVAMSGVVRWLAWVLLTGFRLNKNDFTEHPPTADLLPLFYRTDNLLQGQQAFTSGGEVDYEDLATRVEILGSVLCRLDDGGYTDLKDVELIIDALRRLHDSIHDMRATHIDRTRAKDDIQRLAMRLIYELENKKVSQQRLNPWN